MAIEQFNIENMTIGDEIDTHVIDYINTLDLFGVSRLLSYTHIRDHCCGWEVEEQKQNLINAWHNGTAEQRAKIYRQYTKECENV